MTAYCKTCPHGCALTLGQKGLCQARRALADEVKPDAYGRITSLALDPIEKKPISCWRPRTYVLSLGSYGCNMRCPFCQNASIAQAGENDVAWRATTPEEIVDRALDLREQGCIGIAYTYNEPLVAWEFVRDCAKLARAAGLANVIVSNGMASDAVVDQLAPLIDAANIDLKCFTESGYRSLGGDLHCVMDTIRMLASQPDCHVEVTTLVVPGLSDDEGQIDAASEWLAGLDQEIPYHLTRFFPQYRMSEAKPTSIELLHRLQNVAQQHLKTVLLGNV